MKTDLPTIPVLTWYGCYRRQWRGLIVPDAFRHPAKFAPGLIERIYRHGLREGWWRRGDLIGDPFGGIAGGGIIAGYHGLNWIGVELESEKNDPPGSPFVELGNANIDLHRRHWLSPGCAVKQAVDVRLIQGDSRRFAELVGRAGGIVTSPPYADAGQGGGCDHHADRMEGSSNGASLRLGYGATRGQIGDLEAGNIDAVITSPPYEDSVREVNDGIDYSKAVDGGKVRTTGRAACSDGYGSTDGQIGAEAGETYWQAMRQVYGQCRLALRPGGVMAVVVKDYVKHRQRVPLCDQTLRLLLHLGFEPVCRVHAMLVAEHGQLLMGGGEQRKSRKSFFRRLAEKKGSPAIDHEEVLVVRRPA